MTETKTEPTDQQLVVRVQKGDKRAFDLLVLKYQYKVQAIVGRFVRDRDEVADVTQEAWDGVQREASESFQKLRKSSGELTERLKKELGLGLK